MNKLSVFLLVAMVSCGGAAPKTQTAATDTVAVEQGPKPVVDKPNLAPVPKVQLPINITDQEQAVAWFAENYWNLFPYADTAYVASGQLEQAFVDWLAGVLVHATPDMRQKAFSTTFNKAYSQGSREMMDEFIRLTERYLYDPNSPMRNEDIYIDALRAQLALPMWEEVEKIRPQAQLTLAMKNRVGDRATEITYTTVDGKAGKLSGFKGKKVVLFFNNPGCAMCKEMREVMVASPVLSQWIQSGQLVVLAVYPDKEIEEWKAYAPNIPVQWVNAKADERVKSEDRYDLRAIPCFYLIDAQGRVELKDVTVEQLLGYLAQENPQK